MTVYKLLTPEEKLLVQVNTEVRNVYINDITLLELSELYDVLFPGNRHSISYKASLMIHELIKRETSIA